MSQQQQQPILQQQQPVFYLQPVPPPPGMYYNYGVGGMQVQPGTSVTADKQDKSNSETGFSLWRVMKKYYLIAFLVCVALGLNEELTNPSTYLYGTVKYWLDQPTMHEFLISNVKGMGGIKESIPESDGDTMSLKDFMVNHITAYWPCVFRGLASNWPAAQNWKTNFSEALGDDKLKVSFAGRNFHTIPQFSKEYKAPVEMTYQQYVQEIEAKNHVYLDEQPIPSGMKKDIQEPNVVSQLLNLEEVTLWQDSPNSMTKTMARSHDKEVLVCVVTGDMKITVVPSWERVLIYPGMGQGMPTNHSPVDFFRPDNRAHENFRQATPFDISLNTGDCLYIPAFWWEQRETNMDNQVTVVTFWYDVASQWLKTVFYGLERNQLI